MNRGKLLRLRWRALVLGILATISVIGTFVAPTSISSASASTNPWPTYSIDVSKFNPGRIITDELFFDGTSMSQSDIQSFLVSKVPVCDPTYTCLKDETVTTNDIAANPMCSKYTADSVMQNYTDANGHPAQRRVLIPESASRIIYKVAVACGISAKVILVTLEKEQGLVTDTWPSARQYRYAMGADCPDTGDGCGLTAGFFQQVYRGAYMMKRYTQPAGTGPGTNYETNFAAMHHVGVNASDTVYVRYGVDPNCGGKQVWIQNQATHVLYVYTPYMPNAAALAAGWGTAHCGAYGNRNFFRYYFMWFGDPNGIPPQMTTPPDQTGDVAGQETVGTTVSVTSGSWRGNPLPTASYQWYDCGAQVTAPQATTPAGCSAIAGASHSNYTLRVADVGKYVAPLVTNRNQSGTVRRMTTSTNFVYQTPVNTVAPAIVGAARPAQAITATTGTWTGLPLPTYSYQWMSCRTQPTTPTMTGCTNVTGATASTITPAVADIGKYFVARVTASNRAASVAFSPQAVQVQSVPLVTQHAAIAGSPTVGTALVTSSGSWTSVPAATATYEYFACPHQITHTANTIPVACSSLAPASTQSSIAVPSSAAGKFIVTRVTQTNAIGSSVDVTSSTQVVSRDARIPVLTGLGTVGSALSATPGTWQGKTTRITLSTAGPLFQGFSIRGVQQALQADGYATPLTGRYDSRTIADVKRFQTRHHVPLADGYVGPRTWSIMSHLTVQLVPTFTYQWLRCQTAVALIATTAPAPSNCAVIPNATSDTYTPVLADHGKYLVLRVTGHNTSATLVDRWSLSVAIS